MNIDIARHYLDLLKDTPSGSITNITMETQRINNIYYNGVKIYRTSDKPILILIPKGCPNSFEFKCDNFKLMNHTERREFVNQLISFFKNQLYGKQYEI